MKSIVEVSAILRASLQQSGMRQADLRARAGVSQRTLTNVLSGDEDFKLSTLLAVADRLGLELLLVPKSASVAVGAGDVASARVLSRVQAALDKYRGGGVGDSGSGNPGVDSATRQPAPTKPK